MTATPTRRILFVCMGNICRSPAAENVFRHLAARSPLASHLECDSAGTLGLHAGSPPDPRMQEAGRNRGYPMTGCARAFTPADFDHFDLILAMDDENLADLRSRAPTAADRAKIQPFCRYLTRHPATEIPDPYYGGDAGFGEVLDLLEDGCANLLASLR
ncbi:low molecular weight protein-tyrosine-phosphatase [soil metagenome]